MMHFHYEFFDYTDIKKVAHIITLPALSNQHIKYVLGAHYQVIREDCRIYINDIMIDHIPLYPSGILVEMTLQDQDVLMKDEGQCVVSLWPSSLDRFEYLKNIKRLYGEGYTYKIVFDLEIPETPDWSRLCYSISPLTDCRDEIWTQMEVIKVEKIDK